MKIELCAFSGAKIYPGRGRLYVRSDNRVSWLNDAAEGGEMDSSGEAGATASESDS